MNTHDRLTGFEAIMCIMTFASLLFVTTSKAHETSSDRSKKVLQDATYEFICENEKFLDHAGLDIDMCGQKFELHGEFCWKGIEPLFPDDEFEGSEEEKIDQMARFSQFYMFCVQANILLEDMHLSQYVTE